MSRTSTVLSILILVGPTLLVLAPSAIAVPTATYSAGPTAFQPLALTAAATVLTLPDNTLTSGFNIGHVVPFFGLNESVFWVSSNGFITLHGPTSDGCCVGQPIPSRDQPNEGVLAGFWTDLDPSAGGTLRFENQAAPAGSGAQRVLIVDYDDVPLKADLLRLQSFQFQVYDTGVLEVHWASVDAAGLAMTSVGVENPSGGLGVEVERSANVTHTSEAVRFTPTIADLPAPAPFLNFVSPGQGRAGSSITISGGEFQPGAVVLFGNMSATTTFFFSQQLTAVVPQMPPGVVNVSVFNPDGGNATLVNAFEVRPPPDPNGPNYTLSTPPFSFLDLGTNATNLSEIRDESVSASLPLGFTIPFFGVDSSTVQITGNGWLGFGPTFGAACCSGGAIPDPSSPNGLMAGLWTDLDPQVLGSSVHMATRSAPAGRGASLVTVVEFLDVPMFFDHSRKATFQMQVYDNGILEVHVQSGDTSFVTATIGVEDFQGDHGVQALRGPLSLSNAAFRFTPTGANVSAPAPIIEQLLPGEAHVGDVVRVVGQNFLCEPICPSVFVGGESIPFSLLNSTAFDFTVPSLPPGPATVAIQNADGQSDSAIFVVLSDETPPPPPTDELTLAFVSPAEGRVGDTVQLFGSGFASSTRAFLGGREAAILSRTSTTLRAVVPSDLSGFVEARVLQDGTGQTAALGDAFLAIRGPRLETVSPSLVDQGATIRLTGSGFDSDGVVLADERALPTRFVSSTLLEATIDPLVAAGPHDVTVLADGLSSTLANAIVVRASADIAVEALHVERPHVATDSASVSSDIAAPQRVLVTLANRGAEIARAPRVVLSWTEANDGLDPLGRAAPERTTFATLDGPELRPGETATLVASWQRRFAVGEFVIRADASLSGQTDARASNNARETRAFVGVSGVRGVTPCDVEPVLGGCAQQPALSERRTETTTRTSGDDHHNNAFARFSLRTFGPNFNFDQPDRIFDTRTESGTTTDCTVWRFFGGRGSMSVSALEGDWIDGGVIVASSNASADGARFETTTTRTFVLGIETDRFEESGPPTNETTPRNAYSQPAVRELHLVADGIRGDFSRCTTIGDGNTTESFVFAALPPDREQLAPNFQGEGFAADMRIFYKAEQTATVATQRDELPPLGVLS